MSNSQIAHASIHFVLASVLFVSAAFAADVQPASNPDEPSKETRQKMAAAHDAMAACLRSDKSIADCRDEMQTTCRQLHGEHGCPMMGMGMHERMKKQ